MHLPPLIADLAVLLAVAAVVSLIFQRIKQPVVLGYIVAGLIVGPHTPPYSFISDLPNIKIFAELGVIFLMFSLGLEFSFRKLMRVGSSASIAAMFEVVFMLALGYFAGQLFGWSRMDSVFLGAILSISSTTIIIKALDELGLKSRRFAQLIFGILIVEDLAAILILVMLSTLAVSGKFSALVLATAAGQLALVIGTWFLAGYFVVPRFVRYVGRLGSNETMTVVSLALCLALVAAAASFHYSIALGAFVMGSILAESTESRRIEDLMTPLRDMFAAVFFVSVGMLINPDEIWTHKWAVLSISLITIAGKIFSTMLGALITGQTLRTAVLAGFGMAQIGEFSFIIASLGLTLGVMSEFLYPVAVAVSILTTFTTPYLIRYAPRFADAIERHLPAPVKEFLARYVAWREREMALKTRSREANRAVIKWIINAFVVTVIHVSTSEYGRDFIGRHIESAAWTRTVSWALSLALSAPFIWGMLSSGWRPARVWSGLWLGVLSLTFLKAKTAFIVAAALAVIASVIVFTRFYRQVQKTYEWFESGFLATFKTQPKSRKRQDIFRQLAPWDGHLVRIKVHSDAEIVGKRLMEVELRKKFGVNVVAIQRGSRTIVAPKPAQQVFPKDELLVLGTDDQIDVVRAMIERPPGAAQAAADERDAALAGYELRSLLVSGKCALAGRTIRESGLMERFECIVVGLERKNRRMMNPDSDLKIEPEDVLWVVGPSPRVDELFAEMAPGTESSKEEA